LVSREVVNATLADKAKSQYHKLLSSVVRERKPEFFNFIKEDQRLDTFLISCVSGSRFTELAKVFRILLILSHGQAQVERGFSTNGKLIVENQNVESLIAQRVIHDHMIFHKEQPHSIKITAKLQNSVRQARGKYFNSQKERSLSSLKSLRDEKAQELNEEIGSMNKTISLTEQSIKSMRATADDYVFQAEIESDLGEMKNFVAKASALKRGAEEKQSVLDELVEKKRMLMKKKDEL
jgi:hypothetical protein